MQTYSHAIITAALNRTIKEQTAQQKSTDASPIKLAGIDLPPLQSNAFLTGSVLPDLPLTLLAIGAIAYDRSGAVKNKPTIEAPTSMTRWLFGHAFFHVWWVKLLHNLFHAPLPLLAYLVVGYSAWCRGKEWGASMFWLAIASFIHTGIDIPLHYDDGPLLLFPFNWTARFFSPVSYWDPKRYGRIVAPLEHLFVIGLLIYLVVGWRKSGASSS